MGTDRGRAMDMLAANVNFKFLIKINHKQMVQNAALLALRSIDYLYKVHNVPYRSRDFWKVEADFYHSSLDCWRLVEDSLQASYLLIFRNLNIRTSSFRNSIIDVPSSLLKCSVLQLANHQIW